MADEREMLLVQSKVRDVIRAKGGEGESGGIRLSDEFLTALNDVVHHEIGRAIERARGNGRATLRKVDL